MLNTITIKAVECKKDMEKFIYFPYILYKSNTSWVPPLVISQKQLFARKHFFWQQNPHRFFIAIKNGKCVGRIAAFLNIDHNKHHNCNEGFLGFLESENEAGIFNGLLKSAEEFIAGYHCTNIIGPFNPSIHYELGVLTKGFEEPPYFMLTHNFSYYEPNILYAGYQPLKDFYSYKLNAEQFIVTSKMKRVQQYLQNKYSIHIRQANMKSFYPELDILFTIYNDAFAGHWGFTPVEKEEFLLLAKDLKSIIDPKLVLIAELKGEPVAFLLCLPNFNEVFINIKNGRLFPFGIFNFLSGKNKIKSARVITVAVKKKFQRLGIGAALYSEIIKRGIEKKFEEVELSWVVEDNYEMNQVAIGLKAVPYKTYRIFSKALEPPSKT